MSAKTFCLMICEFSTHEQRCQTYGGINTVTRITLYLRGLSCWLVATQRRNNQQTIDQISADPYLESLQSVSISNVPKYVRLCTVVPPIMIRQTEAIKGLNSTHRHDSSLYVLLGFRLHDSRSTVELCATSQLISVTSRIHRVSPNLLHPTTCT